MDIVWKENPEYAPVGVSLQEAYVDGKMVAWLQRRPSYCDRGHWQVNVDLPEIDAADGFPRYYMREEAAKAETNEFLMWRLRNRP